MSFKFIGQNALRKLQTYPVTGDDIKLDLKPDDSSFLKLNIFHD
jgi:hypothetical protein